MPFPALIPSPSRGVWHLGPVPLRAYAFAMIAAILVAWWIGTRRYVERGGKAETMLDITCWAVPFGIVGARIYHVITSPDAYFGKGGDPWKVFAIWEGGLGVWGSIALGAVGAMIGARRAGVRLAPVADSLAPAILIAQGIGRLGNWFNQELFGSPTDLPWGLKVSDHAAVTAGFEPGTLFHPTFAYEMLWNFGVAGILLWLDRRRRLSHGRLFALYVATYTLGRVWIEALRVDPSHHILGLRINVWTSILLGVGAVIVFIWLSRRTRDIPDAIERAALPPQTEESHDDVEAAAALGEG